MTDEIKVYDLSQVFILGKPRKKKIYCNRSHVSKNNYGDEIKSLITKSFNSNRYYGNYSFNRYDKKWSSYPDLDVFEITVCTLKPKRYNREAYESILSKMNYNDLIASVHTLGNNALTILNNKCESIFPYTLREMYNHSKDGLFVVLDEPVTFVDECSKEPAITQYAAVDVYNTFLKTSIEKALTDCGLAEDDTDGYYKNDITVNANDNKIRIKRRFDDKFIKGLKQKIFNIILSEICEYNDGAIRKFLKANKIEIYGFADQLFNKFKMDNLTFYFDLDIERKESNDTL